MTYKAEKRANLESAKTAVRGPDHWLGASTQVNESEPSLSAGAGYIRLSPLLNKQVCFYLTPSVYANVVPSRPLPQGSP